MHKDYFQYSVLNFVIFFIVNTLHTQNLSKEVVCLHLGHRQNM